MNFENEEWNFIAINFQKKRKKSWFFSYLNNAYMMAVKTGLTQLAKHKENKIKLLKTDLWNETIETDRNILSFIERRDSFKIYGIDVSYHICHLAKETLKNTKVVNCDIRSLPFISNFFDIVIDISTIDHVPENQIEKVIEEYKRILNDGGILVLISWYKSLSVKYCLLPFLKYVLKIKDEYPQYYFTLQNLHQRIAQNFKIVKIHYLGSLLCHPYIGKILTLIPGRLYKKFFDLVLKLEFSTRLNFIFKHLGGLVFFVGEKHE